MRSNNIMNNKIKKEIFKDSKYKRIFFYEIEIQTNQKDLVNFEYM